MSSRISSNQVRHLFVRWFQVTAKQCSIKRLVLLDHRAKRHITGLQLATERIWPKITATDAPDRRLSDTPCARSGSSVARRFQAIFNKTCRSVAVVSALVLLTALGCRNGPSSSIAVTGGYPSLHWYADLYSSPLAVRLSPDGRSLLIYDQQNPAAQTLRILDVGDLKTKRTLTLNKTCLRFTWSPDGRLLAFFCYAGPTRELYLWDMERGKLSKVEAPQTRAESWLAWSPDGRYLAYKSQILASPEPTQYELLDIQTLSVHPLSLPSTVSTISWVPDSQHFVLLDTTRLHSIDIVGVKGELIRRCELGPTIKIKSIISSVSSERLLVLSSHSTQKSVDLGVVAHPCGRLHELGAFPDEPESLTWSPDEANAFFTLDTPDGRSLFQFSLKTQTVTPIVTKKFNNLVGVTSDSTAVIFRQDEIEPESWFRYRIDEKKVELIYRPKLSALPDVPGRVVSFPTIEHYDAQIIEHRSPRPLSPPAVVISLHGGSLTTRQHLFWDSTAQISLRDGVHWLEVNYRGAIGSPFQGPPNYVTASTDVEAAIEYAHNVLHVPYSRIAVRGNSEGAMVAVETARRFPSHIGLLLLSGLVGTDKSIASFPYSGVPRRVVLFHLKYDQNTIAESREVLETALTSAVTHDSEYHEYEIDDEHGEVLPTTRAAMYEVLLNMIKR